MTPTRRMSRRALLAVAVLAALGGPGISRADHTQCATAGSCPEFTPDLHAVVSFPYTDATVSVGLRTSQADHESHIVLTDYFAPLGWRFAPDKLRPAQAADGSPATGCDDVFVDGTPKTLERAEAIGYQSGARVRYTADPESLGPLTFEGVRSDSSSFSFPPDINYGFDDFDGAGPLALLDWDGTTARLCRYLHASGVPDETAREFMIPVSMSKLAGDPTFGWRFRIDWTPMIQNEWLRAHDASSLYSVLNLSGTSAGNWNTNPVTGDPEGVAFSRTPTEPGTYPFAARYTACAEGVNESGPVCRNGTTKTVTRTMPIVISPPPGATVHDYAELTGPSTPGLNSHYALLRGTDEATMEWAEPGHASTESIKAYELQVAAAGDMGGADVHHEYVLAADACEETGCAHTLGFPLNAGTKVLLPDGTFDVRLITIYADGHRTDGRCDDATNPPGGLPCPAGARAFRVKVPGYDWWEFMIRSRAWPLAYVQCCDAPPNVYFSHPRRVLLLDYDAQEAELVRWRLYSPPEVRRGRSNLIRSADGENGVVSWGDAQIGGNAQRFRFDGYTQGGQASARMTTYDLKGLGNGCPPQPCGGVPTSNPDPIELLSNPFSFFDPDQQFDGYAV